MRFPKINISSFLALSLLFAQLPCLQAEPNKRAEELVDGIRQRFEKTPLYIKYGKNGAAYSEDAFLADPQQAKVMTLVQGDGLIEILEDREFKNLHQIGYSGGGGHSSSGRLKLESDMAGKNLRKLIPNKKELFHTLPKYGMVEFPDFALHPKIQSDWSGDISVTEELDSYGEIAIYFKDHIRRRTTFLPQDSGNFLLVHTRNGATTLLSGIENFQQALTQKRIVLDGLQLDKGSFFEAQIWGKLTIDDIAYVVIPDDFFYDTPSVTIKQIKDALKLSGIPVYKSKTSLTEKEKTMERLRTRTRGRLLYAEDLSKRRTFLKSNRCRSLFRQLTEELIVDSWD